MRAMEKLVENGKRFVGVSNLTALEML